MTKYAPTISLRLPSTRQCPTCKGTGINPVLKFMVCPKCKGETRVPAKDRWSW